MLTHHNRTHASRAPSNVAGRPDGRGRGSGRAVVSACVFVARYIVCSFIKIPAGVIYDARTQACEPNKTLAFFNRMRMRARTVGRGYTRKHTVSA